MGGGLANAGNTCSINSMLQCLGHCVAFRELVLEGTVQFQLLPKREYSLFQELRLLFHQLWKENHSLIPLRFLHAYYESLGDLYQPGEQFDFTEMWLLTLNTLQEETKYTPPPSSPCSYKNPLFTYLEKLAQVTWAKLTPSPVSPLFHGIQINQIKCKHCEKIFHNAELFSCTYLETDSDLNACFAKYYATETLQDWTCDHCKEKEAEKMVRFWKLPPVWVIALKRFQGNKPPVQLTDRFTIQTLPGDRYNYQLKALANHYGSLHSGHYTAHCKTDSGWSNYDDTQITHNLNIKHLLETNSHGYVLFFELQSLQTVL